MSKKRKLDWKPVALPQSVILNGIDDLVGIEELCDYSIERNEIVSSISKPKKKAVDSESIKSGDSSNKIVKKDNCGSWIVTPVKVQEKCKQTDTKLKRKKNNNKVKKAQSNVLLRNNIDISPLNSNLGKSLNPKSSDKNELKNDSMDHVGSVLSVDGSAIPQGMEAWSSFNLPICILQALSDLGYKKPTQIQELTLPSAIMGRRDILGAAETGSGKTLAFGIPIIYGILQQKKNIMSIDNQKYENIKLESNSNEKKLNRKLDTSEDTESDEDNYNNIKDPPCSDGRKLYGLILTPTRELAMQVKNHLVAVAKYTNIKIIAVIGGMAPQKQERLLKRRPEIVVATPGRLWEMIESGNPHLERVDDISFLAIDETDRMLEKGHFQELQTLLERINRSPFKKKRRQNFVFSATLTLVHEPPKYLGNRKTPRQVTPGQKLNAIISSLGITNPKVVDITVEKGTATTLSEARIVCSLTDKDYYLYYILLRHTGRTVVFCNSISCVRRLGQILDILQCKPYLLHANMQQRQRLKNLERFRDSPTGLLLATDVAARGLDIPNVQHVIHYQVPRTTESYVHRSGRTARAQKEGITILLMEAEEVPFYLRLCKNLGRVHDLPDFPVEDRIFSAAKGRVTLARQIDKLEHTSKQTSSKHGWFQKAAKEMDIELDEDELPFKMSDDATAQVKRQVKGLRRQLLNLLEKPVFPNTMLMKYSSQTVESSNSLDAVAVMHEGREKGRARLKIVK